VRGMMADPGEALDHRGDAVQRPQLAGEPVGRGAFQERLLNRGELLVRELADADGEQLGGAQPAAWSRSRSRCAARRRGMVGMPRPLPAEQHHSNSATSTRHPRPLDVVSLPLTG
jgi:hypothetical protein